MLSLFTNKLDQYKNVFSYEKCVKCVINVNLSYITAVNKIKTIKIKFNESYHETKKYLDHCLLRENLKKIKMRIGKQSYL